MRRAVLILILATSLLTACAPQAPDCARADVFCAGLVTDFGSIDTGIAHEAWLGLQDARSRQLVDRADFIETVDTRDRAANIRFFADAHYDVVVTVGAAIAQETIAAAKAYPKQYFIGVEQPQKDPPSNLTGLVFREDESGYLAGALAALMTETGHVAAICEAKYIQPMRRYCDGFQAGALHAQPGVDVSVAYRQGSPTALFNDPDWGRQAALKAVDSGADVVFAAGGSTADAALQAAAGQGVYVIGSETDAYGRLALIREELLTSATSDVRSGVVAILSTIRHGAFRSGQFTGDVGLAPWHDNDRQIPASVKDEVKKIQLALEEGTLKTGVP